MMRSITAYTYISPEMCNDVSLNEMYRGMGVSYPKFFKMDTLSKAGFLAAEKVLSEIGMRNESPKIDMAVALVNSSSSTCDDVEFNKGLGSDAFFPSPSLFVYTLSNIVCGEIAIRNRILGETSFYIEEKFDYQVAERCSDLAFADESIHKLLLGWVECHEDKGRGVIMMMVEKDSMDGIVFDENSINNLTSAIAKAD